MQCLYDMYVPANVARATPAFCLHISLASSRIDGQAFLNPTLPPSLIATKVGGGVFLTRCTMHAVAVGGVVLVSVVSACEICPSIVQSNHGDHTHTPSYTNSVASKKVLSGVGGILAHWLLWFCV